MEAAAATAVYSVCPFGDSVLLGSTADVMLRRCVSSGGRGWVLLLPSYHAVCVCVCVCVCVSTGRTE